MKPFMFHFDKIKPEVKKAALLEYLNKCYEKQMIAYYQWRYKYPPVFDPTQTCCRKFDKEMVLENLDGLAEFFQKTVHLNRYPDMKT